MILSWLKKMLISVCLCIDANRIKFCLVNKWQRFILRTLVRRGQAWKIIIISIVFVWMTIRFAISSLLLYCWFYYFGWCWTIFNFLLVDWYFGWLRRDVTQSNRESWNLILIFIRVRIVNFDSFLFMSNFDVTYWIFVFDFKDI